MNGRNLATLVALVSASAALAHQGVQNASVKARMDEMSEIADNIKVLGTMSKGTIEFDADAARTAAAAIADSAALIPTLFKTKETDAESEAKPEDDDDASDEEDYEIKLDLARAYISLGDKEASRSMLDDVIKHGNDSQVSEARQMLDEL